MRFHHVALLMAATKLIGCTGARTDVSAIMPPPGAMRVCDEGVIDAPGVVSARPNFVTHTVKSPDDYRPRYLTIFDTVPIAVSTNDSDWRIETPTTVLNSITVPPDESLGGTQFAQLRRNLYMTGDAGVGRVDLSLNSVMPTGLPPPGTGTLALGGAGTWLADGFEVAYRWTLSRTVTHDLEVTSAPAPYQSIANGSGVSDGVVVTIPLPFDAVAGDVLRLFRSLTIATAAAPADTMYLAAQVTLDASHTLAGEVVITDETDAADLGEALYTNSTREGIEGANGQPPRAFALATWGDSLWAGATRSAQALVLDVVDTSGFPIAEEQAAGVLQPLNYGTTAASPVLAYVSGDETGMANGHSVIGTGIPVGARILSFVPGVSITLDVNATATASPVAMQIQAVHTIDGQEFLAVLGGAQTAASINEGSDMLRARYIENAGALTGRPGYFRILIERATPSLAPFTFATTATGGATSYAAADGGALTSEQEDRPNRIAWSKPREPEHWRALDWLELGREDAQVLAFAPLSDALLVFKEDGVWSVFGTFPNFGTERIDDAIIMGGDAVTVIDDTAYARTDRGILALTGAGVAANLTEGVISGELEAYTVPYAQWARAWPTQGLVLFGVGNTAEDEHVVYVWNIATRAWCRWTTPARQMAYGEGGMYAAWAVDQWEVRESVPARGYDEVHEFGAGAWSSEAGPGTVTILSSDLGTYAPAIGDIVEVQNETPPRAVARVVGVGDASSGMEIVGVVLTLDTDLPTGSDAIGIDIYDVATGALEWQRLGVTPPSVGGFVRELHVHLDQSDAGSVPSSASALTALRLTAGGTSDLSTTRHTLVAAPTREATYSRPVRFGLSRQLGRSTHLYPYVEIGELYAWRVLGIALVGNPLSDRVRRS